MHPTGLHIIEGKLLASTPYQRLVRTVPEAPHLSRVQVYHFTEKKTDVNLATDLLTGAWLGAYEQAVVCTNDSALAAVRQRHPSLRLGLVAPIASVDGRRITKDLVKHAHWSKTLSAVHLQNAQLPERIPGTALRKPDGW